MQSPYAVFIAEIVSIRQPSFWKCTALKTDKIIVSRIFYWRKGALVLKSNSPVFPEKILRRLIKITNELNSDCRVLSILKFF
jgi:hypothetical protein